MGVNRMVCWIVFLLFLTTVIVSSFSFVEASSYHRPPLLYHVVQSDFTDHHAIDKAKEFWLQYGFVLKETEGKGDVNIEFIKYCKFHYQDQAVGYYDPENKTTHMKTIVISTFCGHELTENDKIRVTTHELGHFVGFDHYSIPIMKPNVDLDE